MEIPDEEVERYLNEFQPRPVRALEVSPRTESVLPLGWIAAAAILFVGCLSFWYLRQEATGAKDPPAAPELSSTTAIRPGQLNAVALAKLALEDNEQFEALLSDKSRTALPRFQGEHSMLRVLAQE